LKRIKFVKGTPNFNLSLSDFDRFMDEMQDGDGRITSEKAYRIIGVANRCVTLRMNAASNVPFALYRGENQIADGQDWKDPTGGIPNPAQLFALLEGALAIFGFAYLSKFTRDAIEPGLRYLLPRSVRFVGISGRDLQFVRRVGNTDKELTNKDLLYLWGPDPTVEFGPPQTSALYSALASARLVSAFDVFMDRFAENGMIKTTLLAVPDGTDDDERDRIENVFQRMLTGVKKAFSLKVINADDVKPAVIGTGLEDLSDGTLLDATEKRVARDLGVPLSVLFANAANFATANQDDRNLYDKTIVPDLMHIIAPALNAQWYTPKGYRLAFNPQALDAFQDDENERASAFALYVNTGMRPSIAAEMLGLELPPGVEYTDLDGAPMPAPAPQTPAPIHAPDEIEADEAAEMAKADLLKWSKMAQRRQREGHLERAREFKSEAIPGWLLGSITHAFEHCKSADDVRAVFDLAGKALEVGEGDGGDGPERTRYERALQRQMAETFAEYEPSARDYVKGDDKEPDYDALRAALFAALLSHYTRVASDRIFDLEAELMLDVDDAEAAAQISAWANANATARADALIETTRWVVGRARDAYNPAMTDEDLDQLLRAAFGDPRYDAIAIYETTDAMSNGVLIFAALLGLIGIISLEVWHTMQDERVCPICGPLDGTMYDVWGQQFPNGPPAHGRCRCYTTLLVK
jgi:hypothetical protein